MNETNLNWSRKGSVLVSEFKVALKGQLHNLHNKEQDINAAVWEVQAQDINAAVWEVQAQDSASSDSRTALQLYNPGTKSTVQSLRLTNAAINSAVLNDATRTSALVLEFPVVPARQKVHNPEPGLWKNKPSRIQSCKFLAGKAAVGARASFLLCIWITLRLAGFLLFLYTCPLKMTPVRCPETSVMLPHDAA
jgi:hypothetical protein